MKTKISFFIGLMFTSLCASAQLIPTTKQECTRRCRVKLTTDGPVNLRHLAKVKEIAEKKKAEKDPEKLKQLAIDEENELERYTEDHEKMCRNICQYNPEE